MPNNTHDDEKFSVSDLKELLQDRDVGERLQHELEINGVEQGGSLQVIVAGHIYNIFVSGQNEYTVQEIKYVPRYGASQKMFGVDKVEKFLSSHGEWEVMERSQK